MWLQYVHMNLCAKNVFITFNNKAKIGDFGMATELPDSSGYVRYTEHRNVSVLLNPVFTFEAELFPTKGGMGTKWNFKIFVFIILFVWGEVIFYGWTSYILPQKRVMLSNLRCLYTAYWFQGCQN